MLLTPRKGGTADLCVPSLLARALARSLSRLLLNVQLAKIPNVSLLMLPTVWFTLGSFSMMVTIKAF